MPEYKIIQEGASLVNFKNDRRSFPGSIELGEDEGDRLVARGIVERLVPEKPPAKATGKKDKAAPVAPASASEKSIEPPAPAPTAVPPATEENAPN